MMINLKNNYDVAFAIELFEFIRYIATLFTFEELLKTEVRNHVNTIYQKRLDSYIDVFFTYTADKVNIFDVLKITFQCKQTKKTETFTIFEPDFCKITN
ncbi:MAG: hypothetical protein Q4A75_04350 [Peptostreptococcaceae bacterium]|nr:hypothetical protein [Peptostreptococcaceae bacterium]